MTAHLRPGTGFFLTTFVPRPLINPPRALAMASISQRPKGRDGALSTLDVFIQTLNLAKDTCGIPPAQAAFGAASFLLAMIRVRFPHPAKTNL